VASPQPSKLAIAGGNKTVELDTESNFAPLSIHTHRGKRQKQRSDKRQLFQFALSVEKTLLRESYCISSLPGDIISFRVLDSST